MSLKSSVLKGSLWSLAGGSGQQLANFFIFLYLARALTPASIGLVSLAAILLEIFTNLAKLGLVEALQPEEPNAEVENALFAILCLSGLGGSIALIAIGMGEHWLKYDHDLANITLLLAPIVLLQAINTLPEALFKRRIDYRSLTIRTWIATLLSGAAAIVMVNLGYGMYALVGQRLIQVACSTFLLWFQVGWQPSATLVLRPGFGVLDTGWKVVVSGLSGLLNTRIADAITGAFLGPAALGYLRLAWRFRDTLVQMTVSPMSGIALTSLSKLRQDREALGRAYLRLTQFMAAGSLPAFFGLGAVGKPFVLLLLGPKWADAAIAFESLGFLMTAGCVNYFFGPIMVAIGRADVVMRQSVAQIALSVPLLWIGSGYGLLGVVVAHTARSIIVAGYNMAAVKKHAGVTVRATLGAILPSFFASTAMFFAVRALTAWLFHGRIGYLDLLALAAAGAVLYAAILVVGDLLRIWPHYVRGAAQTVRDAIGRR